MIGLADCEQRLYGYFPEHASSPGAFNTPANYGAMGMGGMGFQSGDLLRDPILPEITGSAFLKIATTGLVVVVLFNMLAGRGAGFRGGGGGGRGRNW